MSSKRNTSPSASDAPSTLVPKLRFPEFEGAGEWEKKTLGELGQLTRGLTYSAEDVTSAGLLVLRATNIQDGDLILERDLVFVGKACPDALRLKTGDIVICMSNGSKALVGKSGEYSGDDADDVTVGAFCSFYRPAIPFAKIAFHLDSYQKYIANLIAGGNINNLTNTVLSEFGFPIPPLPAEQQRIASCLSSLDELITAQAQKVEALKTHKKGLMQQLFPREGETQPRLRFPEFRGAEEWNDEVLEDLLGMPATYGIVTAGEFQQEGIPMLRGGDIKEGCVGDDLPFVTAVIHNQYRRTILQADDVVIALVGYPGEAAVVPQHYVGANISRAVGLLRLKEVRGSRYLAAYLNSPIGRRTVLKPSAGSAQVVVNLKHLNALVIPVPKPDEQQRIADCLSSLDELITSEINKLDVYKTHKKGLMQQLFPSTQEQ